MLTVNEVIQMLDGHQSGGVGTRELVRWLDDTIGDDVMGNLAPLVQEALLELQSTTALYVPGTPDVHAEYVSESAVQSAVRTARVRIAGADGA